jgi:hypothetical protein
MLCTICYDMLRGQEGRQWRGTYDLIFAHHASRVGLKKSAEMSCCICRIVYDEVETRESIRRKKALKEKGWMGLFSTLHIAWLILPRTVPRLFISAYLSEIHEERGQIVSPQNIDIPEAYRLDLKLQDSERIGTFVLQKTGL